MQRGNLIIYDNEGTIFLQTGEAEGDVLPHVYPAGLPYIEMPFGSLKNGFPIRVDVSKTPHELVFQPMDEVE